MIYLMSLEKMSSPGPLEKRPVVLQQQNLTNYIETCVFNDFDLNEILELSARREAEGVIKIKICIELSDVLGIKSQQTIYLSSPNDIFEKETKNAIEQKMSLVSKGSYSINSLWYEYQVPSRGKKNGNDYLVMSRHVLL